MERLEGVTVTPVSCPPPSGSPSAAQAPGTKEPASTSANARAAILFAILLFIMIPPGS